MVAFFLFAPCSLLAQDKEKDKAADARTEPANKPVYVSPSARLAAAKTAVVLNAGGSDVPYNVISNGIEGWGKYRLVDERPKADIVIEVISPEEETSSVSTKTRVNSSGRAEESSSTTRNLSNGAIKLVVSDAKTRIVLWSASEQPKGALRQRAREDHLVEAASRLLAKFRERIEPPAPASK
jgi:hypothetical protein